MRNASGAVATVVFIATSYLAARWAWAHGQWWLLLWAVIAAALAGIVAYGVVLGLLRTGRAAGRAFLRGWRSETPR